MNCAVTILTILLNQLTKFSARDAGHFSDVVGEREMDPKCGSLPQEMLKAW